MSLSFTRIPEKNWHRALPAFLNKICIMQLKSTSTFKITPKLQNDLLNHYLGQGKSSLPAGVYQVLCAACSHH